MCWRVNVWMRIMDTHTHCTKYIWVCVCVRFVTICHVHRHFSNIATASGSGCFGLCLWATKNQIITWKSKLVFHLPRNVSCILYTYLFISTHTQITQSTYVHSFHLVSYTMLHHIAPVLFIRFASTPSIQYVLISVICKCTAAVSVYMCECMMVFNL